MTTAHSAGRLKGMRYTIEEEGQVHGDVSIFYIYLHICTWADHNVVRDLDWDLIDQRVIE